jgi:hypothetical protein
MIGAAPLEEGAAARARPEATVRQVAGPRDGEAA